MASTAQQKEIKQADDQRDQTPGRAVPSLLPSPEHVAYFAGLGALVLFGLIEWPVAVAIGTGTLVAERMARKDEPAEPAEHTDTEQ